MGAASGSWQFCVVLGCTRVCRALMLAYAAFAWVARLRNFILALVVTVVLVVLARWALVA